MNDDTPLTVDLHGLYPDQALRRLAQALHTARVRGDDEILVITGRGMGNEQGRPVLRGRVEAWLRGASGRELGVVDVRVTSKGGALQVLLS